MRIRRGLIVMGLIMVAVVLLAASCTNSGIKGDIKETSGSSSKASPNTESTTNPPSTMPGQSDGSNKETEEAQDQSAKVNPTQIHTTDQSPVIPDPVLIEPAGDLYAVIIGIDNYLYLDDLGNPDEQAIELHQKLDDIWGDKGHFKLLLDSDASRTGIEEAICTWLAPQEKEDDTVLILFGGHGNSSYIAPYDSWTSSYSKDISANLFNKWLNTLDSEQIIVVLDTCGAAGYGSKLCNDGRVILNSCGAQESCYGDFTDYFIKGFSNLETVDTDNNHKVSIEEIFSYTNGYIFYEHPCIYDRYSGELMLIELV